MKVNNILLFGIMGLIAIASLNYLYIIYKYVQILIHHGVYYCQEMINALNLHLQGNLGKSALGVLVLGTLVVVLNVLRTAVRIYLLKFKLAKIKIPQYSDLNWLFEKLNLMGKVVIINESKPRAFCFGVINPKIYVSTGMITLMNRNELEVVLRHEKSHLAHYDSITHFMATIVESLFPFFPIISDIANIYRTEREIQADSDAVSAFAEKDTITKVLKKLLKYEPLPKLAYVPNIISEDSLEARIHCLHTSKVVHKKISRRNIIVSIVAALILTGLVIFPVKAIEAHEAGADALVTCADSDSCSMACRQHALLDAQNLMSHQTLKNFSSQY